VEGLAGFEFATTAEESTDARIDWRAGDGDVGGADDFAQLRGGGEELLFSFVVENGKVESTCAVGGGTEYGERVEVLGADMRIGEHLENGFTGIADDVAGFVVEGDDGASDFFGKVKKGRGDGFGDGEFVSGDGVDLVFEPF